MYPEKLEKIVCIRSIENVGIIEGSIYNIIIALGETILIKNDAGYDVWLHRNNFITLADFRNNRINEILDETN